MVTLLRLQMKFVIWSLNPYESLVYKKQATNEKKKTNFSITVFKTDNFKNKFVSLKVTIIYLLVLTWSDSCTANNFRIQIV